MNCNKILAVIFVVISIIFISPISVKRTVDTTPEPTVDEKDIFDRATYYKEHPEILAQKTEPIRNAKMLAIIADAVAPSSDAACKMAIMNCIINRSETAGFPNTIEDVCKENNQWQGYSSESTYTNETYALAKNYLNNLDTMRLKSIDSDLVYLRLGNYGIFFRAAWNTDIEVYVPYYTT